MFVECIDNSGFEDQLTQSQSPQERIFYGVQELEGGSVLIKNDMGEKRWYGMMHFRIPNDMEADK